MKYVFLILFIITIFTIAVKNRSTSCSLGGAGVNKIKMGKILLVINAFELDCSNVVIKEEILTTLTSKEHSDSCFRGAYLKKKDIIDSFGNNFKYVLIKGNHTIWSSGEDGVFGNEDDQGIGSKQQASK